MRGCGWLIIVRSPPGLRKNVVHLPNDFDRHYLCRECGPLIQSLTYRLFTPVLPCRQYQGEEIGTINAPISYPIEDYRDCDTIGFWADLRKASNDDPEILELGRRGAQLNARDQGRMPMQWDNSEQGGFTTAKEAWQKVNPYYKEINVAAQEEDPESVLSFYKQMINFRRAHRDLLVYGTFELLDMDNEQTVTYLKGDGDKQAIITLNFTKEIQPFTMPKGLKGVPKLALSNVEGSSLEQLRPFEGRIYFVNC